MNRVISINHINDTLSKFRKRIHLVHRGLSVSHGGYLGRTRTGTSSGVPWSTQDLASAVGVTKESELGFTSSIGDVASADDNY